ncbi:phospholipid-transporting ATPase ABCA3-like [Drosophila sulfurigaster albostrigata]|uniref:phospholipid-transporting ATPase ABCA3-like n=1 Tax=Drosophila sulfurigaster albostrigata TaxID=89887 RepID=UPI002D2199CB|nr:phospholipid-transporting ATPase ABCA3-like [Drosophila sulfurigaster albostrigata]
MHYAKWDPEAVLREQNKSFNKTRKFALAFWKTLNIQKSYKLHYVKIFLISLVFLPILVLLRGLTIPKVENKVLHDPVNIDSLDKMRETLAQLQHNSSELLIMKLYYTPRCKPCDNIIATTVKKLKLDGYDHVADDNEMELRMQQTNYLAGVKFLGMEKNITELPIVLDYELRFPPVLRTSPIPKNPLLWGTDNIYSQAYNPSDEEHRSNYTGVPPGYFEEGFVQLQHAIAMSFLELKSGHKDLTNMVIPQIQMVSFPRRRHVRDEYLTHLKILLPLTILFTYAFPSISIVKAITDENERGIMKMMRIEELNWCAWFSIIFLSQVTASLIILLILSPSYGSHAIFEYSNWVSVFFFLVCYVCANCSFILMISVVVVRKSKNARYALMMRLITIAPYTFMLVFSHKLPMSYSLLACLSHDTGLAIGLNIILEFESSGEGFAWKNFRKPHFAGDTLCCSHVCGMLLLDSVIYMLILVYQHYKNPPELYVMQVDKQTVAKKWYYPLKALYEHLKRQKEKGPLLSRFLWFLVVQLTVHEDDLYENKDSASVEHIGDKRNQTVRPSNMVDAGTMTTRRLNPASTSDKDLKQNFRSTGSTRIQREAVHKRRVANEPPDSSSSFESIKGQPERLHAWSSVDESSFSSVEPESLHSFDFRRHEKPDDNPKAIVNEDLFDSNKGIQVLQVTKTVGDTDYLNDITMIIHPNEITVILNQKCDHNNMLLSHIITGDVKMSSGRVIIDGNDVQKYKGTDTLCTILRTDSIVFSQLTTIENLYFYMHLRGMRNYRQIVRETRKYLSLLKMDIDEAECLADNMSFGQARCLSVCCTLCGGNHAVIIEDPSQGLTSQWKYRMWDLLKHAGLSRVLIVNTSYCDEAEYLGDRIAVVYCGLLQCYDRNLSLHEKFCNNYSLLGDVLSGTKAQDYEFMTLLRQYFPSNAVIKNLPSSGKLDVTLPMGNDLRLADLLDDLQQRSTIMGLGRLWVKVQTLRDVFMKDFSDISDQIDVEVMNEELQRCFHSKVTEEDEFKRTCLQFGAFMHKKIIQLTRFYWLPITIIVLLSACVFFNWQSSHFSHLPRINITLTTYPETVVLMKRTDLSEEMVTYSITKGYEKHHRRISDRDEHEDHVFTYLVGRRELKPYLIFLQMISILRVATFYVVAADVSPDSILCFWNNKLVHAAPISLNMMHNALAIHLIGPRSEIRLANHPITFSNKLILEQYNIHSGMVLGLGNLIILVLCASIALMVVPLISEFTTGNRRVIYLSGNNMTMYWVSHMLADMFVFTVVIIYLVVLLVVHDIVMNADKRNYDDGLFVFNMFLVLFLFGMAVLPFVYLIAALFARIFFGFMVTLFILGGSSVLIMLVIQLTELRGSEFIYMFFFWSSTMNMYRGLRKLHVNRALRRACEQLGGCKFEAACCHLAGYADYEYPGIMTELVLLVLQLFAYGYLLVVITKHPFIVEDWIWRIRQRYKRTARSFSKTIALSFHDVWDEHEKVEQLNSYEMMKLPLVFKDVSKRVGNQNRLNNVSFMVQPREVFGIVGMRNSGKSDIISMTVGAESITSGDIYVAGISVRQRPKETYTHLGYCPGGNALLGYMSVREILRFYCLLNGRKVELVPQIIDNLCDALNLNKYMHTRIDRLGFSQRRKLTVGISVLSSTKTVMMEEPTRGMGQWSKVATWQLIRILKHIGRTVVMATEDFDEAIELCDTIAYLANGSLRSIGTVDQLTSLHSRGCLVEMKVIKVIYTRHRSVDPYVSIMGSSYFEENSSPSEDEAERRRRGNYSFSSDENDSWHTKAMRHQDAASFMEAELPMAELRSSYDQHRVYYIPFEAIPLSSVFRAMAAVQVELDVYSYRITCTSLSEIYESSSRQHVRHIDRK